MQDRIVEDPDADRLLALRLLLELRHPAQLAEGRDAVEDPGQLGVGEHVALDEQGAAGRVEAGGEQDRRRPAGPVGQAGGVVGQRDRVEIDDAVEGVVAVLGVDPLADGTEVVAEMHLAGGLDAREDPCHRGIVQGATRAEPSDTLGPDMGYEVRTAVYEGPFDLLLHLILRQEVDLWELSLATIVDEYLTELERLESLDLDVATEFLLIAATLVELKTRRLLPAPSDLDLDEDLLRFEERDLLLARLLECKTFKDAARAISALMRRAERSVARAGRARGAVPLARSRSARAGPARAAAGARPAGRWPRSSRRSSTPITSRRSGRVSPTRSSSSSTTSPSASSISLPAHRRRRAPNAST